MRTSKPAENLELALIRLEYAVADYYHRARLPGGNHDPANLEALLSALVEANRLALNALWSANRPSTRKSRAA